MAFLVDGKLGLLKALLLLGLFLVQLPFPQTNVRYGLSVLYVILAVGQLIRQRHSIPAHLRLTLGRRSKTKEAPEVAAP